MLLTINLKMTLFKNLNLIFFFRKTRFNPKDFKFEFRLNLFSLLKIQLLIIIMLFIYLIYL